MPQANEPLIYNLAHELRQPLSTIESIAYYLELSLPHADPRVQEQLTRLRHLVEQSGWILNDALSLAEPPAIRPQAVDIDEMLSEFVFEQMQHDASRPQFELQLCGMPVWLDYQYAHRIVSAVCRLFRSLAKPGAIVHVSTSAIGSQVMMRAWAEGLAGDDGSFPAGTQLTVEAIERAVAQSSATVFTRLSNPAKLELAIEFPAAPGEPLAPPEFDEVLPSFEAVVQLEPAAPGTL